MYELECAGVIPGCERVIRAESQAEVMRRAVAQARAIGIETITPTMMEAFRSKTRELAD